MWITARGIICVLGVTHIPWIIRSEPFTSADIGDHVGFAYELAHSVNSKKYVGKKKGFFSTNTMPPLKGSKRKRKRVTESDWQSYSSSSPIIKVRVEDHGIERTKSEMTYLETRIQFFNDVLSSDDGYDNMVTCRISSRHLKELRTSCL